MGTISLVIPQIGQPDTTEDVKVQNAFTTIQTVINGNIDTNNISASAGITRAQLAAGAGALTIHAIGGNFTASNGQLILTPVACTVGLPAPAANAIVGVVASAAGSMSGASPVTVFANGGANVIFGPGQSSASGVLLGTPGAYVVLQSDGTDWFVISGQQDTGWVALTLLNSWTNAGGYTPAARLLGDRVFLKGHVSTGAGSTVVATLASQFRPASSVVVGAIGSQVNSATVATTGDITAATTSFGLALDGLNYSLS